MAVCLSCGKECETVLCGDCAGLGSAELEALCLKIIAYQPQSGENPMWEEIISGLENPWNFRNTAFALASNLPSPRREYIQIMSLTGNAYNVPKASRRWFFSVYDAIINDPGLAPDEASRLHAIAVKAGWQGYEYERAEAAAKALKASTAAPWEAYRNLAEYYSTTRRYGAAEEVIARTFARFGEDAAAAEALQNARKYNEKQKEKARTGKQEYMPNDKSGETPEETRRKYVAFLESLGIRVEERKKVPTPIPRGEYPAPMELREPEFDSFVAFDLETTGYDRVRDSVIEFGGVKVVNGEIVGEFQELAKPFERKISPEIEAITGITASDVENARPMWEVFRSFMEFAGDEVLLGYNCMSFDSQFMVRAGRYANLVISNRYFDLMHYTAHFQEHLGIGSKAPDLEDLAERFGIENPHAHRALSDAVTTAKVFLALRKLEPTEDDKSPEDPLADLDNW